MFINDQSHYVEFSEEFTHWLQLEIAAADWRFSPCEYLLNNNNILAWAKMLCAA